MASFSNSNSIYKKFSSNSDSKVLKSDSSSKNVPLPYRQIQRPPRVPTYSSDNKQLSRVSVHIAGMQYLLIAPDNGGEAYVHEIAERAEQMISQIQKNAPGMSMTSVTVLALVNAIDEWLQKEKRIIELENELSSVDISRENDKVNYIHLREINWELKKEVLRLQSLIDQYENCGEDDSDTCEKKNLLPLEELEYDVLEQESSDD
jgi:cell division protein ZapA (FtsZ GTPase activity inhibitor)